MSRRLLVLPLLCLCAVSTLGQPAEHHSLIVPIYGGISGSAANYVVALYVTNHGSVTAYIDHTIVARTPSTECRAFGGGLPLEVAPRETTYYSRLGCDGLVTLELWSTQPFSIIAEISETSYGDPLTSLVQPLPVIDSWLKPGRTYLLGNVEVSPTTRSNLFIVNPWSNQLTVHLQISRPAERGFFSPDVFTAESEFTIPPVSINVVPVPLVPCPEDRTCSSRQTVAVIGSTYFHLLCSTVTGPHGIIRSPVPAD